MQYDIEQLLGLVSGEQDTIRLLRRVANSDLGVDVCIRNRHVVQYKIGEVNYFQHLADYHCAGVSIGTNRLIAPCLDGRKLAAIPKRVEIDFGRATPRFGLSCLAAIGHDLETQWHLVVPLIPQLSGIQPVDLFGYEP